MRQAQPPRSANDDGLYEIYIRSNTAHKVVQCINREGEDDFHFDPYMVDNHILD